MDRSKFCLLVLPIINSIKFSRFETKKMQHIQGLSDNRDVEQKHVWTKTQGPEGFSIPNAGHSFLKLVAVRVHNWTKPVSFVRFSFHPSLFVECWSALDGLKSLLNAWLPTGVSSLIIASNWFVWIPTRLEVILRQSWPVVGKTRCELSLLAYLLASLKEAIS